MNLPPPEPKSLQPAINDVEVGYRFSHVALDSSEFEEFKKALESSGINHYIKHDASGNGYEVFFDKSDEILVDQLVAAHLPDNPNFAAPPMNFTRAVRYGFTKWTFKGRASRSEYWFFFLAALGVSFSMGLVASVAVVLPSIYTMGVLVFVFAVTLFLMAAVWKVQVRRMHDRNVGGLKLMLRFLPSLAYVGLIFAPAYGFFEELKKALESAESTSWTADDITWSADVLQFRPVLAIGSLDNTPPSTADDTPSSTASDAPAGAEILLGLDGAGYLVGPVAANGLIFENNAQANIQGANWSVVAQLRSGAAGADLWNALTARCYSRDDSCPTAQIAIVLDGEVISAPVVQEAIFTGGEVQITGDFAEQEASDLAKMLNYSSSDAASDSLEPPVKLSLEGVLIVLYLMSLAVGVWIMVDMILPGRPARNRYDRP